MSKYVLSAWYLLCRVLKGVRRHFCYWESNPTQLTLIIHEKRTHALLSTKEKSPSVTGMSKKVIIPQKWIHGLFLGRRGQIWHPFLKLTKCSLIMHAWWHIVIGVSNKVIILQKSIYGVFLGREDQIWHPFLKSTKSSLIMHAWWHIVIAVSDKVIILQKSIYVFFWAVKNKYDIHFWNWPSCH